MRPEPINKCTELLGLLEVVLSLFHLTLKVKGNADNNMLWDGA